MAAQRSLYSILNVASDAEFVVIEAAYRALMKKYHPDQAETSRNGPSAAEINHAFATLRDPNLRADYDRREWSRQQQMLLARYPPPAPRPPRRPGFFGWSGWMVAALLGAVIALMAYDYGDIGLRRAAVSSAVLPGQPQTSSQPVFPEDPLVTRQRSVEIQADALALETPPVATQAAKAGDGPRPAARPKPRRAQRPAGRASSEADFREREGYIY